MPATDQEVTVSRTAHRAALARIEEQHQTIAPMDTSQYTFDGRFIPHTIVTSEREKHRKKMERG